MFYSWWSDSYKKILKGDKIMEQDYQDYICKTLLNYEVVEPLKKSCSNCRYYNSKGKCRMQKINNIIPFINSNFNGYCYKKLPFKQKIIMAIGSTCIIVE